jgi:hypothetical protein
MYKFSIDIADRNGSDFRRRLRSADRLRESAMVRALDCLKTPPSRSMALLVWVTRLDQRREADLDVALLAAFRAGFLARRLMLRSGMSLTSR